MDVARETPSLFLNTMRVWLSANVPSRGILPIKPRQRLKMRVRYRLGGSDHRTEKEWARYRAENRLDIYGRRISSTAERVGKDSMRGQATPEE